MVDGKQKSRSSRKVFTRTPSQGTKVHFKTRKNKKKTCAECGAELPGIPHKVDSKFKNLPKTKKRPQRPYAGVLCSRCMRKKIREKVA